MEDLLAQLSQTSLLPCLTALLRSIGEISQSLVKNCKKDELESLGSNGD